MSFVLTMRVWVDSLLFTSGVPLKMETIRITDPALILDLRKRTERSHYYEREVKATCESLEMEQGKVYCDTGRAVKDKNATMKRLCQQMVSLMKQKQSVLIVCYDGLTSSGFIASIVRWWYECSMGTVGKDHDYIKQVRDANDFTTARGKEQRAQMKEIQKEALKIMEWETRGFVLDKKKRERDNEEEDYDQPAPTQI
jgi:mannitol-specific phosphotransferase system IIBC component